MAWPPANIIISIDVTQPSSSVTVMVYVPGDSPVILSDPLTLELAKIVVDTSYYGWLINYAQISKIISDKFGVDYDEMWSFSDEIHKFLKNRPKMFPGFIGGHCVIPNLELIDNELLNQIDKINKNFAKKKKK